MKTILFTVFLMLAAIGIATPVRAASGNENTLVVYFSWSGNTRSIASQIHQRVGGDLVELELVTPYSRDYNTCLDQASKDLAKQARPPLKTHIANMEKYDVIFLGYPNWWSTIPMPIATFLEGYDFSGKTIVPFVSNGGGRQGQSISDISKLCPKSTILESISIQYGGGSSLQRDLDSWLRKIGMMPQ